MQSKLTKFLKWYYKFLLKLTNVITLNILFYAMFLLFILNLPIYCSFIILLYWLSKKLIKQIFIFFIVKIIISLFTIFRMEIWTRTPLWSMMPFTCSLLHFIKSAKFRQVEKNEIHILHFYSFVKIHFFLDCSQTWL